MSAEPPAPDASGAPEGPPERTGVDLLLILLPIVIAWSGVLVSGWAWKPLSQGDGDAGRLGLRLFGTPVLMLGLLAGVRATARGAGAPLGRPSRIVLIWVMTFLGAVHGLVLALSFGLVEQPGPWLAPAVGLLFFGLSPLVERLEMGSVLGIRTRATLASAARWRHVHRVLALAFFIVGAFGVGAIALSGDARVWAATLPAAIALTGAVLYGSIGGGAGPGGEK